MTKDEAALAAMHSTVGADGRRVRSLASRLATKYEVQSDGCWLWTGGTSAGYGVVSINARSGSMVAHRAIWLWRVGPIAPGLELDHLCRVRGCVNPNHLEPVSHRENGIRGLNGDLRVPKALCPAGHDYATTARKNSLGHTYCRECMSERQRRQRAQLPKQSRRLLTNEQVRHVRARSAAGASLSQIGLEVGIGRSTIWRIIQRMSYQDVP